MSRYDDIDPMDIDPNTGRPYSNYSSPSLDTSFHDGEMDIDEPAEIFVQFSDCGKHIRRWGREPFPGAIVFRMN